VGVDEPPPDDRGEHRDLIGFRGRIAVGVVFFVLYALTFGLRGHVASGLVGGALGGVLFFLLLRRAEERRRHR
jgi:membrane associated rhomboid family serine protease